MKQKGSWWRAGNRSGGERQTAEKGGEQGLDRGQERDLQGVGRVMERYLAGVERGQEKDLAGSRQRAEKGFGRG